MRNPYFHVKPRFKYPNFDQLRLLSIPGTPMVGYLCIVTFSCSSQGLNLLECSEPLKSVSHALYVPSSLALTFVVLIQFQQKVRYRHTSTITYAGIVIMVAVLLGVTLEEATAFTDENNPIPILVLTVVVTWISLSTTAFSMARIFARWLSLLSILLVPVLFVQPDSPELVSVFLLLCPLVSGAAVLLRTNLRRFTESICYLLLVLFAVSAVIILVDGIIEYGMPNYNDLGFVLVYIGIQVSKLLPAIFVIMEGILGLVPILYLLSNKIESKCA